MPMRSRFRLWLKKRGGRRTGSPRMALSGELLYHGVFIAVGAVAMALHIANVLTPAWQLRQQTFGYSQAECKILDKRATVRDDHSRWSFQPECRVQLVLEKASESTPVWAAAGEPGLSEKIANYRLSHYIVGESYPCWYSPTDARQVTLVRGRRVWPWLVTLFPFSFIVLGGVGMARSVLRAGVSPERRRTVARNAGRLEALLTPTAPIAGEALPRTTSVTDSPGVRLRYRLPSLGDAGWRVATLATICVVWNLLVLFFLVGAITEAWAGDPQWALLLLVAPLAMVGIYMAVLLVQDARTATGVGVTSVEVTEHPLTPGQSYAGVLIQSGQFKMRSLSVALVCEEVATYCEGTDTRTSLQEVHRITALREQRREVTPGKPYEQDFTFTIPADVMHSFKAAHNEVRWVLEVRATPIRWPSYTRKFLVCVYPSESSDAQIPNQHGSVSQTSTPNPHST